MMELLKELNKISKDATKKNFLMRINDVVKDSELSFKDALHVLQMYQACLEYRGERFKENTPIRSITPNIKEQ